MNATGLISVIVRSMDRPGLSAALASIAAQAYRPIEAVVVPASGRAHRPLPDAIDGVTVRLAATPGGPLARPAAANVGLDSARGEWIIFLDDDDVFLPGHLDKLARALRERDDAVAAYADVDYGRLTDAGWQSEHVFAADFDPQRLRFENFLPMHAVLFRRRCVAAPAACRFDEGQLLFEDWDFWLQLAGHGAFVRSPGVSARYVAPSATDASGVFVDSPATQAARERLLAKWQRQCSPAEHVALMSYVQGLYRKVQAEGAQLADARAELEGLKAMLAARDTEVAALAAQANDLRAIVAARDASLADAAAHAEGLTAVLQARDAEIAALLAQGPLQAFKGAWKRRNDE